MATLLIVDDQAPIRNLLYGIFEGKHLCHMAESAEQALELIKTTQFDVILLDISMPGMSGLELLTYSQQLQPETPIVIITGIDYQQHSADLLKLGAFDYLIKPFALQDAEETVKRALGSRPRRPEEG